MARPLRFLSALGAFFVLAALVAACGSGVPGNAVARVDDEVITRTTFDHWLKVAALSSQPPGAPGGVSLPDPPAFRKCIAAKRGTVPKPPPGQPAITDKQLRDQCRQEFEGLRDQVMQFLIQAEWLQGEAVNQGIKVPEKEVQESFQRQKQQSFPNDADYQRFLRTSGMTQQDVVLRVKLDLISNKIREKITKGGANVTDKQVSAYYEKNKERFAQPEQRDVQVILTKTEPRARQALQAVRGGEPWARAARRFSTDQASKRQGGRLTGVTKGQQEQAFDEAIFKATRGQLLGPVKTQFGYYVFRVTRIVPGKQQSLEQVREAIKRILQSENQQKSLDRFIKRFQKEWQSKTNCRKGYVVELCKNAPKPKRTSTVPPGAVPPGGAPGQPPQGPQPVQP